MTITSIELLPGNQLRITFTSTATNHRVDMRGDIVAGGWSPVSGVAFAGAGPFTATFAKPVATQQFYKVVILP